MNKKIIGIALLIIVAGGSAGSYIYYLYSTAESIEVNIDSVAIDDVSTSFLETNVDLRIFLNISATKGEITIQTVEYSVYIFTSGSDPVFVGDGIIEEFTANPTGNIATSPFNATFSVSHAAMFIEFLAGENLIIRVDIHRVQLMGIWIQLDTSETETVNINDLTT